MNMKNTIPEQSEQQSCCFRTAEVLFPMGGKRAFDKRKGGFC